jgi:CelD/BcsL family acetyltransferase involved in cellulose biosynthesis
MRVELVTRYEDLASRSEGWNVLTQDMPFLRWEWLGAWWRHYGRGQQLFVPLVRDDQEQLVGLAPWFLETHPAFGRVVRFLGSGEACTDYLTILSAPGKECEVAEAIADWLDSVGGRGALWDQVELIGAAKDDAAVWRLIERLAEHGNTLHRRESTSCWRIELPGSWEEFQAQLSKTHRRQVRRALQRYEENGAAIHRANMENFNQVWDIFVELHQGRRESLGERGCFASDRFGDFLRDASEQCLATGTLRLSWLEYDGRPIAAEYMLQGGGVVYAYQAGVDPKRLDVEPGRMIAARLIQGAIEEGLAGFDFMRGDEPYKAHWRAKPRQLVEWRVIPRRAMPQIRHTAWLAGGAMKNWLKKKIETQSRAHEQPSEAVARS